MQALEEFGLLIGGEPEKHHGAIAKHHGEAGLADPHRERRARQHLALEAGRIDAVADLQRMHRELAGSLVRRGHGKRLAFGRRLFDAGTALRHVVAFCIRMAGSVFSDEPHHELTRISGHLERTRS